MRSKRGSWHLSDAFHSAFVTLAVRVAKVAVEDLDKDLVYNGEKKNTWGKNKKVLTHHNKPYCYDCVSFSDEEAMINGF